jgi:hypothetical protein
MATAAAVRFAVTRELRRMPHFAPLLWEKDMWCNTIETGEGRRPDIDAFAFVAAGLEIGRGDAFDACLDIFRSGRNRPLAISNPATRWAGSKREHPKSMTAMAIRSR